MNIDALVDDYVKTAKRVCTVLSDFSGTHDLLGAWLAKKIARVGIAKGLKYTFHGRGVGVDLPEGVHIEIDFDDDGACDVFDVDRLAWFAASRMKSDRLEQEERVRLEQRFNELVLRGIIVPAQAPGLFRRVTHT